MRSRHILKLESYVVAHNLSAREHSNVLRVEKEEEKVRTRREKGNRIFSAKAFVSISKGHHPKVLKREYFVIKRCAAGGTAARACAMRTEGGQRAKRRNRPPPRGRQRRATQRGDGKAGQSRELTSPMMPIPPNQLAPPQSRKEKREGGVER